MPTVVWSPEQAEHVLKLFDALVPKLGSDPLYKIGVFQLDGEEFTPYVCLASEQLNTTSLPVRFIYIEEVDGMYRLVCNNCFVAIPFGFVDRWPTKVTSLILETTLYYMFRNLV